MRRFAQLGIGTLALCMVALVGAPAGSAAGDPVGGSNGPSRVDAGQSPLVLTKLTITFNTVPSSGNPILTHLSTDGYSFDGPHFHTIDTPGNCGSGGCVNNGTIYVGEEQGGVGQPFKMTRQTGGKFILRKVLLAQLFNNDAAAAAAGVPNATSVKLTGKKANGSKVVASFTPPNTGFALFALPTTFIDLVSVKFSANGAFGADNIKVKQ